MDTSDAWLDGTVAGSDPIALFRDWFQAATDASVPEPTAVALATATLDGRPSVRMVLLKGVDDGGFVFFTNFESRKSRELAANPRAGLAFFWAAIGRQVRVEGTVAVVSPEESDAYFATRPFDSQLGAWASAQSSEIESRAVLDARLEAVRERHREGVVPRPPHWGGFRLRPDVIEFWASRPNRMHDRFEYRRDGDRWSRRRLCP